MKIFNTKSLFLLLVILLINNFGFAQPTIEWSVNYGGSESDVGLDMERTSDGRFIIAGWTESTNGDIGGNNGGQDGWVLILDNEGNLDWEKNYGGSSDDFITEINPTNDGGYIVVGSSTSDNGDVGGNNGDRDVWILKLDSEGAQEWSRNYGGSDEDEGRDVIQTADNGYALLANSKSINGDVEGNNGDVDFWILKVDNVGNIEWSKNYGGSDEDEVAAIKQTPDGGFLVAGSSRSSDGDVGENQGSNDCWIIKLDNEGNLEYKKHYGGTANDEVNNMEETIDGGYILAGRTRSIDGDLEGSKGGRDGWVLKLDADANLEWSRNYGGSENETATSVIQTISGEYIVAGHTRSNDGDIGGNYGEEDGWVMRLTNDGNIDWVQNFGGSDVDLSRNIIPITDDEFIILSWSLSDDVDLPANNGDSDIWVMKLTSTTTSTQTPDFNSKITVFPNPSNGQFTIDINDLKTPMSVRIFDTIGNDFCRINEVSGPLTIGEVPKGNYLIQIVNEKSSITRKLIVH